MFSIPFWGYHIGVIISCNLLDKVAWEVWVIISVLCVFFVDHLLSLWVCCLLVVYNLVNWLLSSLWILYDCSFVVKHVNGSCSLSVHMEFSHWTFWSGPVDPLCVWLNVKWFELELSVPLVTLGDLHIPSGLEVRVQFHTILFVLCSNWVVEGSLIDCAITYIDLTDTSQLEVFRVNDILESFFREGPSKDLSLCRQAEESGEDKGVCEFVHLKVRVDRVFKKLNSIIIFNLNSYALCLANTHVLIILILVSIIIK